MHADITYKHWTGLNVFVNTIVGWKLLQYCIPIGIDVR